MQRVVYDSPEYVCPVVARVGLVEAVELVVAVLVLVLVLVAVVAAVV